MKMPYMAATFIRSEVGHEKILRLKKGPELEKGWEPLSYMNEA